MVRPPLILTGGPGVGKTATALAVAGTRPACAVVDVDDVRHLVITGHAAPWEGTQGSSQRRLGAANACCLARNFLAAGIDVVIADVLTQETSRIFRASLPGCQVIRFVATLEVAQARAASRAIWLSDEEFRGLHRADAANPPDAHYRIKVDDLTPEGQAATVARLWGR